MSDGEFIRLGGNVWLDHSGDIGRNGDILNMDLDPD
jgi:hypothetical protein